MKRLTGVLVLVCLLLLTGEAFAAQTANITVKVKVQYLSVAVAPDEIDFGVLTTGSSDIYDSYVAVTNDGNVTEKFKMGITAEPNGTWVSVTDGTVDAEEYRLSAIFQDTPPSTYGPEDSFSKDCERIASGTALADTGAEGELGYNVAESNWRKLWFKFEAPSSTIITTEQSIVTEITAMSIE